MRRARGPRAVATLLLFVAVVCATGCDRLRDALDGLRRSTGEQWERSRRRLGG